MRKLLVTVFCFLSIAAFSAFAQMTDEAVVEYVKREVSAGKGEKEIGQALLARGVTIEQMQRIKALYEESSSTGKEDYGSTIGQRIDRKTSAVGEELSEDRLDIISSTVNDADAVTTGRNIYGHNVFNGRTVTFEPNENVATPENYKLGPGDEVIIDMWGINETSIRQTISPEGRIIVSQVGPIYLNGLTIKAAAEKIRRAFSQKYAGVNGSNPSSEISVTLGQIRTIQINVMGEVRTPGTYRVSSFATVFHAIYRAGGITPIGSLREVKLIRAGKPVATVDLYDYLVTGSMESDIKLMEGDVIQVPTYSDLVSIEGNVKRPMFYEVKDGETVQNLLEYAGGFASDAFKGEVRLVRQTGLEREIMTVSESDFSTFKLTDGDVLTVDANIDRFANRVEVRGAVFRPGMYQLGGDIATVRQLVEHASGLKEDAFRGRAIITREKDDLTLETLSFNIGGIMDGTVPDIVLRKNDILIISSFFELNDTGTLEIRGYVAYPGEFPYAANTSIEDLIIQAGGLLDGASTVRVDVARRVNDPRAMEASDKLSETYTFSLKDGLMVDGGDSFVLAPYDVVNVRKSPDYNPQKFVSIEGEVVFPGAYVLQNNSERLSSVVERAGGFTPQSYMQGAILVRKADSEEQSLYSATRRMLEQGGARDPLDVSKLQMGSTYNVAIDLAQAVAHPGSEYDLVLKEGDRIVVPEYLSTVQIQGDVMYPNTVLYLPGKSLKQYINEAGGFGQTAKRNKVYIIHMNGDVSRGNMFAKVEPGSVVVVPSKNEGRKLTLPEIMSMGTTAASLGTMAASIANMIVRIGK